MKTIIEIPTKGDEMTLPGGIALRYRPETGEFIVHNYNTDRETGTAREYWQGSYMGSGFKEQSFAKALAEVSRRVERASLYDLGGALDMTTIIDPRPSAAICGIVADLIEETCFTSAWADAVAGEDDAMMRAVTAACELIGDEVPGHPDGY